MTTHAKGVFAPRDGLFCHAGVAFEVSVPSHLLSLSRSHPLETSEGEVRGSGCGDGGGNERSERGRTQAERASERSESN
jgi:hypothetical protein